MSRIKLLTQQWRETQLLAPDHSLLKATVIKADNALEYALNHDVDQAHVSNIAPPLDNLLLQMNIDRDTAVGVHIVAEDVTKTVPDAQYRWQLNIGLWLHPQAHRAFVSGQRHHPQPLTRWHVLVTAQGHLFRFFETPSAAFDTFNQVMIPTQDMDALWQRVLQASFFALNLMHCKNVALEQQSLDSRAARMAKNHDAPVYRYHILKLKTGKASVTRPDFLNGGWTMSEHLVRGHFKTYTAEKPMGRGKVVGTFFVPQFVRGDRKKGRVEKDYQLAEMTE